MRYQLLTGYVIIITEVIHGNVWSGLLHILSYYPHPFLSEEKSSSHDILNLFLYIIHHLIHSLQEPRRQL